MKEQAQFPNHDESEFPMHALRISQQFGSRFWAAFAVIALTLVYCAERATMTAKADDDRGVVREWEYHVDYTEFTLEGDDKPEDETTHLQGVLDKRGAEGWELVGRISTRHTEARYVGQWRDSYDGSWFVFKRAKR